MQWKKDKFTCAPGKMSVWTEVEGDGESEEPDYWAKFAALVEESGLDEQEVVMSTQERYNYKYMMYVHRIACEIRRRTPMGRELAKTYCVVEYPYKSWVVAIKELPRYAVEWEETSIPSVLRYIANEEDNEDDAWTYCAECENLKQGKLMEMYLTVYEQQMRDKSGNVVPHTDLGEGGGWRQVTQALHASGAEAEQREGVEGGRPHTAQRGELGVGEGEANPT